MKKIIIGVNDLATTNPELIKEWNSEKNEKLTVYDVMSGSSKKVWWKCSKGHSYEAFVSNRAKHNTGCPYCANKKVLKGFNDIESKNPILIKEWNYEKNKKLNINDYTYASNKKVWWKCNKCGNEWESNINHRTIRNHGCPYCSGRVAIKGETDLATTNPELLKEWNYEKNTIKPEKLKSGSHDIIWWKCEKGHDYQNRVYEKTKGLGCPYCSGKRVLLGFNDLGTTNPELVEEWDFEKNMDIDIQNVSRGSDVRVWWKCSLCKHEWNTKINTRAVGGTGCPNCHKYLGTSFQEQAILFYLKKMFDISNRKIVNNIEIDIFINDLNVGIEYDGFQWHKNSLKKDNMKDLICLKNKIKLIRIRENGLKNTRTAINIIRKNRSTSDLENCIENIFSILNVNYNDIDIKRDRNIIISNYMITKEKNSFKYVQPIISNEWDYKKNYPLTPEMVSANCNEKVWWICSKCNHTWQSAISSRNKGSGCPKCADKKRIITRNANKMKSGNSLQDKFPNLASEWNYKKNNNDLNPSNVSYGSSKKVWWKCEKGHEYEATINSRTYVGAGCPICVGKKVLKGYNDLATTNPELINEWNYEKNNILTPYDVTRGSSKKVWWKCEKGHEWKAIINRRSIRKQGCPICYRNNIR